MCGTHEISCQRPKGCCASEIFSSQKTCVASEEVNCVIPPRGYDELIHNPTTATEDKKQEPCMGFCTANPDSWDEKCSWGKTCSGCSQCKANQNQGPCLDFCALNPDSWREKCTWGSTCKGCSQCNSIWNIAHFTLKLTNIKHAGTSWIWGLTPPAREVRTQLRAV